MAEQNTKNNKDSSGSRDNLALIVGGIIVLGLIFAAYSYFNQNQSIQDKLKKSADRVNDIISSNTERQNEGQKTDESAKQAQDKKETISNGQLTDQSQWVANNYSQGDLQQKISDGKYTVVRGDTLWEIAEAVYGNGAEWTKILNANSSGIGFLPSGQQALIVPGQVLVLP